MKRVVILKSCSFLGCSWRSGFVHNLDDSMAEALLAARIAYLEGDEPPLCEADVEKQEAAFNRAALASQRLAALRRSRALAKQKRTEKIRALEEATAKRIEELKAARKAVAKKENK